MNKIKQIRNNLGITVRELSEKSNVAIGYISTLENDEECLCNPSKNVMKSISDVLGKTVQEVFY